MNLKLDGRPGAIMWRDAKGHKHVHQSRLCYLMAHWGDAQLAKGRTVWIRKSGSTTWHEIHPTALDIDPFLPD